MCVAFMRSFRREDVMQKNVRRFFHIFARNADARGVAVFALSSRFTFLKVTRIEMQLKLISRRFDHVQHSCKHCQSAVLRSEELGQKS